MEGKLKRLDSKKGYGFIETGKADYFFHQSDFDGHWKDLCDDYDSGRIILLEFEPTRTDKGLRAADVSRKDGGV